MRLENVIVSTASALSVFLVGVLFTPVVFAGRVLPAVYVGEAAMGGISKEDIPGALDTYNESLRQRTVTLQLRDKAVTRTLAEVGVELNVSAVTTALKESSPASLVINGGRVLPRVTIDSATLRRQLESDFADRITPPRNASLKITQAGKVELVEGTPGETVDNAITQQLTTAVAQEQYTVPLVLSVTPAQGQVLGEETTQAQQFAETLLREGFTLTFKEKTFTMKQHTLQRLIKFFEQVDPKNEENQVLGLTFDPPGFEEYLTTTIVPEVNQDPHDARFEISDARVTQFAVPQQGRSLNIQKTATAIAAALARNEKSAELAVEITEPNISTASGIEKLGLTTLLARGESDYAGSPKNRIHNIKIGASRYHGVLVTPGEEFSFLKFLGPVDGAHDFLPELVIKQNVTTPEFGGGLCQVSTTAFRAAVHSGLKVTQRRNHSYAVRYYGTPGFDATIYPPYTDLRFLNDTPGYILIQTRSEGTKLIFEFWGTADGRQVEIKGPNPYNRQPDGAVKATLTQHVVRDGATILEDTFYSNYKSPKLFPKVLAANGEAPPSPTPVPILEPSPSPSPAITNGTPSPTTAKATPKPIPPPPPQE